MNSYRNARTARSVVLKTPHEIELMRQAGRIVRKVLNRIGELVRPGVTSIELNQEAEKIIAQAGAIALFKGVEGPGARYPFPAALCTSVNEEVVHGIPDHRVLRNGDIISVDCGVKLNDYCGDAAMTFPIGQVNQPTQRLLDVTSRMLEIAIEEMRPGVRWGEIARKMQKHAEGHGFTVVRQFVGHGIGQDMHEDPKVPNYYDRTQARHDFELQPGLVLAVEPMVNMGTAEVEYKDHDCWAVVTRDRKWAAHFEHTIAITQQGCDVLTLNE